VFALEFTYYATFLGHQSGTRQYVQKKTLQSYRDHRTAKIVLSSRFADFQLVGDFQTSSLHLEVKCLH
jgi:hypothetical protein